MLKVNRIKELMAERGLTQRDLAKAANEDDEGDE